VTMANGVSLDFMESTEVVPQHYAFLVDDDEFAATAQRLRSAGCRRGRTPGTVRRGRTTTTAVGGSTSTRRRGTTWRSSLGRTGRAADRLQADPRAMIVAGVAARSGQEPWRDRRGDHRTGGGSGSVVRRDGATGRPSAQVRFTSMRVCPHGTDPRPAVVVLGLTRNPCAGVADTTSGRSPVQRASTVPPAVAITSARTGRPRRR
jgi:hypothetical protein